MAYASTQSYPSSSTDLDTLGTDDLVETDELIGFTQTPLKLERRQHRRTDVEQSHFGVERYDGPRSIGGRVLGEVINLSPGGILMRCEETDVRVGAQLRIRLRLPVYAGIYPFVASDGSARGTNEWCGWMTIVRVKKVADGSFEVAGRLVDMREIDRGMLGLYLSAQPLAA